MSFVGIKTVLLIDKDLYWSEAVRDFFAAEAPNFQLLSVESLNESVEVCTQFSKIDFIICDSFSDPHEEDLFNTLKQNFDFYFAYMTNELSQSSLVIEGPKYLGSFSKDQAPFSLVVLLNMLKNLKLRSPHISL